MLALIAVTVFSNWDPTRVHYVDRVGNAILVRGPSPINASNAFDLASMTSIIVAQAKAEGGYDLPTPFDLVDFTMLSNLKPSEGKELTAEKNFFSAATTKFPTNASKLIPWTVIGDLVNPNSYSTAIAKEMALNYESRIDEIPKKVRLRNTDCNELFSCPFSLPSSKPLSLSLSLRRSLNSAPRLFQSERFLRPPWCTSTAMRGWIARGRSTASTKCITRTRRMPR